MRTIYSILFFFCFIGTASAQKVYFIYLQTEDGSSFYVKMSDKIFSATTSGYLILSNLVDSTYNFSIGFPSSQSESKFSVPLRGKDRGFLIKNSESGPGLFDLQTLSVIQSQKEESKKNTSYQRRNDDFTALLVKAANDTSLLWASISLTPNVAIKDVSIKKEEPQIVQTKVEEIKPKTEEDLTRIDTSVTKPQTEVSSDSKKDVQPPIEIKEQKIQETEIAPIDSSAINRQTKEQEPEIDSSDQFKSTEPYKRSSIKKNSESSTSEGFGLVFYDKYEGGIDTIRLLIPNPKITFRQDDNVRTEDPDVFVEKKKDTILQQPVVSVKQSGKGPGTLTCPSSATDNDFFKLRKNMASKSSDDAMVEEAKKIFKNKCFSTEQIKNLSALFLTSAGKYQFFDAAFFHVTDKEQFGVLESEIKEDYYLKRFKALIGE